jgi:hypothetical protein
MKTLADLELNLKRLRVHNFSLRCSNKGKWTALVHGDEGAFASAGHETAVGATLSALKRYEEESDKTLALVQGSAK